MREPRWNTSNGLKQLYPSIVTANSWEEFATVYDEAEAQGIRLKAWRAANPKMPQQCRSPEQLEDLACVVLGKLNARMLYEERMRSRSESAERLANIMLKLVTEKDPKALRELLAAVEARKAARKVDDSSPRNIADAVAALLQFLRLNGRLPSKKALNIEANRMKHNCAPHERDEPRWDPSTFSSKIIKPAGLTGLPRG